MVEHVEKLHAELDIERLRDSPYRAVLEHRGIPSNRPGPINELRPEVPSLVCGLGKAKHDRFI
jgi:hypothetical protein